MADNFCSKSVAYGNMIIHTKIAPSCKNSIFVIISGERTNNYGSKCALLRNSARRGVLRDATDL